MFKLKQIRVISLAVVAVLLVVVLYRSQIQSTPITNGKAISNPSVSTTNKLIDSKNDAKLDAMINKQISDDKDGDVVKGDSTTPEGETATFDAAEALIQIRSLSPMTIFSKSYCPYSKKLKDLLLSSYQITPAPTVVELDKHEHGKELQAYLAETTGRRTVPNVLVGKSNESRGGCDDLVKLHEDGELLKLLIKWGGKKLDVKKAEAPSNL
ncbi:thioredoxin-like protein [Scheffersomyces xylosifermentans]|uniref:thioredoxin-like protein n=1 Tax=Scheffersomyces xylosifermentans TaxID=1304137 RepID=UPI00315CD8D4